ncbi:hypothetical protein [Paludisphaera rhizosphaerae]|uniref:hypothetical protein n=1 Tax=Paludisphaera rhizosphaerae TaxID=2711216 RepID=UPI0013EB3FF0|nr:hypothetical protein [Paludisphaera rhizosphaerae]
MDSSTDRGRRCGRWIWIGLISVGLAATAARGQEADRAVDKGLDEISRLFGVGRNLNAAVKKLGGKVAYSSGQPVAVDLAGTKTADADLTALKDEIQGVTTIKTLDLSGTKVTDAGLAHLKGLNELTMVRLARTRVTDDGVAALLRDLPSARVSRRPRNLQYFPSGIGLSRYLANWYAEDLFAMEEPSLWSLSQRDPRVVVYRFLWSPSFHSPVAVRVVATDEGATLYAARLEPRRGDLGGKPTSRRTIKLSRTQWADLRRQVDEAGLWSLPSMMWTNGIADGAGYLVEAVEGGRYHLVDANTNPRPNERQRRYLALCESLVRLSGLDVMDLWKRYL